MLCQPDTETLKSCHYHGVQVPGVKRSWPTTLVYNVAAHRTDGSLPVSRVNHHLHLSIFVWGTVSQEPWYQFQSLYTEAQPFWEYNISDVLSYILYKKRGHFSNPITIKFHFSILFHALKPKLLGYNYSSLPQITRKAGNGTCTHFLSPLIHPVVMLYGLQSSMQLSRGIINI